MNTLTRRTRYAPLGYPMLAGFLILVMSGCAMHGPGNNDSRSMAGRTAPEHSEVRLKQAVDRDTRFIMTQAAQKVTCNNPLGCSCTLDGFATSCSFVFDCIDAGLCECVAGCDNLDP